ncbi:hypothetical protein FHS42_000687 [Streptomyces zagrosensis]|uniref:Uncharacterized protein n=1 Tax=Streptomyces zagrosensis TaxID=1042984 RepID=A0A7W9Q5C6_9ACTN|nr:hypothetical protein [Streptomyces zagrosensis]
MKWGSYGIARGRGGARRSVETCRFSRYLRGETGGVLGWSQVYNGLELVRNYLLSTSEIFAFKLR